MPTRLEPNSDPGKRNALGAKDRAGELLEHALAHAEQIAVVFVVGRGHCVNL
jgi:hypothetical protein